MYYVPSWFPGAQLLRRAKEVNKLVERMFNEPYEQVKNEMVDIYFFWDAKDSNH